MYIALKILITALVVAGVSELAKRLSFMAAALASLPLTSILAFIWTYEETKNVEKIIELSHSILWLIIPSALFFILLPIFLKMGIKFYPSLILACVLMLAGYGLFYLIKKWIEG
jgi:hypothetical protein